MCVCVCVCVCVCDCLFFFFTITKLVFFEGQNPLKKVLKSLKKDYFECLDDP